MKRINAYSSIAEMKKSHADLDVFAGVDAIEASLEWFDLLQRNVYGADNGVRYYLSTENEQPQVILPIRFTRYGFIKHIESLSNYYSSLYAPLHSSTHAISSTLTNLIAQVACDFRGTQAMRFAPMNPESSDFRDLVGALRNNGWIPFPFFCFGNWYTEISGSWDDYFRSRSSNLRSSISRRGRQFEAAGGIVEIISTPDHVEKAIADFQTVYAASWKQPEPYSQMIPSLIRLLAKKNLLRLGIARLKGQAIASQLWIVGSRKASIYKVAYDEASGSFSPGTVLTSHLLRHVIDVDKVTEVDFLIGDDDYKKKWMDKRRERWGIIAYNPRSVMGLLLTLKEMLARKWKRPQNELKVAS